MDLCRGRTRLPHPAAQVPLSKPTGGKFNMSKPKTDLEWIETRSKQLPGPGQYDVTGLAKKSGGKLPSGLRVHL